ncbi:hypothetical protein [Clostridium perfringens]|nr:hypothetical protein [Clostridium perfringens]MDT9347383.1 hypothetical protein [Clostridium perfringens]
MLGIGISENTGYYHKSSSSIAVIEINHDIKIIQKFSSLQK